MLVFSNCKINIGLHVINKRVDGFHNLETIFYPIPLNDVLELNFSSKDKTKNVSFDSFGLKIDGSTENNLIVRAYNLLCKDFDLKAVNFTLLKNIPMGAGLGGGSSNAAFALQLLNDFFLLNISKQKLKEYAAKLGSDCTFFIDNVTSFATGRGEVLEPVQVDLQGCFFVLVKPNIHVSTASAFANVPKRGNNGVSLKELVKEPIYHWKNLIENDFEKSVFGFYPEIGDIKNQLYEQGALYASMSGSGSSVFGLFKSEMDLKRNFSDCFYFSCFL